MYTIHMYAVLLFFGFLSKEPETPMTRHFLLVESSANGYKMQLHIVDERTPYTSGLPRILPEFLSGPLASLEKSKKTSGQPAECFYITESGDELLSGTLEESAAVYSVTEITRTKNLLCSTSKPSQFFKTEGCIPHCQSNSHHNLPFTFIALPLGACITTLGALSIWRRFQHRHPTIRIKIHPKKSSQSVTPTDTCSPQKDICDAIDTRHSHSFMNHHDQDSLKHKTASAPVLLRRPVSVSSSSIFRRHSDTSVIRLCKHNDDSDTQNLSTKSSFDYQTNHWTEYQVDQAPELELDWFEPEFA